MAKHMQFTLSLLRKTNADGSEDVWDVYRRYSDFHDLHMTILERVSIIIII